jgi:hypothetical protein
MKPNFAREYSHVAKNTRKVNRANHGKRPASSKARRAKRKKLAM